MEKEEIEKMITENLLKLDQKDRIELIESLSDKFGKMYDSPIMNDNIKEFAKQIKACDNRITCIPVGIYSWIGQSVEFNVDPDIVINSSLSLLEDYHKNNKYLEYVCPDFTDNMTKGTWKMILTLWTELIDEAKLFRNISHDCDYVETSYSWLMIYDIANEKFEVLEAI